MPVYTIAAVGEEHLGLLADILNYYVLHTTVTFHKEPLTAEDMWEKVFFSQPFHRSFLILEDESVIGYCALSPWKKQEAYRNTAEVNIYLDHRHMGKGIGSFAIRHLEDFGRAQDMHTLIAGLCSENLPSRRLFEKNGYLHCATFTEVGHKLGRVLDVIYLQKML